MPEMFKWEIDSIEKLEEIKFDAPDDPRRFFSAGDNPIAGVGDGFERNSPPWIETVKKLYPERMGACINKIGHSIGFCGNSNIQIRESGDHDLIRKEVLTKLNAAKGGGFIFQSDHSVASNISGKTYDYIVNLVREYGQYPLNLGKYDQAL